MESNGRSSIVFGTVAKFAAFGASIGVAKSGIVAVKTGISLGAFVVAPAIGAACFGLIGLIAGLAKAGIHKTKFDELANREMGYLGQVVAAVVLLIFFFVLSF